MGDATRTCPQCAETIKAEAVVCRFCKYDFGSGVGQSPGRPAPKGLHPLVILIIIVGAAVPVLAIVAAIAIPGLLASQRAANERHASVSLKMIATAEADFRSNDRDGNKLNDFWTGDVRSLHGMVVHGAPIMLIESAIAQADTSPGGSGAAVPKMGYYFSAVETDEEGKPYDQGKGRNPMQFAFCAYPANPASGRRTFIVNEDNTVWSIVNGGKRVTRWPARPEAAGWKRLD